MRPSYILLAALLIATSTAIYGTYLYLMGNIRLFLADDLSIAIQNLLNTEPGTEKEAVIALPHDLQIKIQKMAYIDCGAPTCIYITTPQGVKKIPTQHDIEVRLFGKTSTQEITLPHGVYTIKAKATAPSPDRVAACTAGYLLITDVAQQISCEKLPQELRQIINEVFGEGAINRCNGYISGAPYMLWSYICARKKIVLEITQQ